MGENHHIFYLYLSKILSLFFKNARPEIKGYVDSRKPFKFLLRANDILSAI